MISPQGKDILEKAHHSISLLLGTRKPNRCPNCNSTEWYANAQFIKSYKEYSDGHEEYLGKDYIDTTYSCHDCGYDCD